jgi:hypothetical protein
LAEPAAVVSFFPPVRAGDAGGRRKRSSSQAHDGEALPGSKYRSSKNFAADNEIHVMQRCKADQSMADNQGRSYQTEPGGYRGISHPKISQGIAEISHRAESELASTLWCTTTLAEIAIVQSPEIEGRWAHESPTRDEIWTTGERPRFATLVDWRRLFHEK